MDSTHVAIDKIEELEAKIYSEIYKIKYYRKRAKTDKILKEITKVTHFEKIRFWGG